MGSEDLRLSKRKAGKKRKLRRDVADEYEEAFRILRGGVKPPPLTTVVPPPGVILRSNVQRARRQPRAERETREALVHRGRELLSATAAYFHAENTVKTCVRCRKHRQALAAETARLHRVLKKILGDRAPLPARV